MVFSRAESLKTAEVLNSDRIFSDSWSFPTPPSPFSSSTLALLTLWDNSSVPTLSVSRFAAVSAMFCVAAFVVKDRLCVGRWLPTHQTTENPLSENVFYYKVIDASDNLRNLSLYLYIFKLMLHNTVITCLRPCVYICITSCINDLWCLCILLFDACNTALFTAWCFSTKKTHVCMWKGWRVSLGGTWTTERAPGDDVNHSNTITVFSLVKNQTPL